MTNYSRGAAFERKIKKEKEEAGWFVIRAAGSKGPVDLLCLIRSGGHTTIELIQCKLKKPTKRERNEFFEFLEAYGFRGHGILVWPNGKEYL